MGREIARAPGLTTKWYATLTPRGQSLPLGLSITNSQLPSGWRRTTSAYRPPVSMSFPSPSRPVSVQLPITNAVSPATTVLSGLMVSTGLIAKNPLKASRRPVRP
jgi:hypothetical protein